MGIADFIGRRGEAIAFQRLAKLCRVETRGAYLIPHYLGEKCRTFDFLVELADTGEIPLFFLAQVKTTRKPMTVSTAAPRLRIEVSSQDVSRMSASPIPAFVVGVHDIEERSFIVAIRGGISGAISSISTSHELTPVTLRKLWEEVRDAWQSPEVARPPSSFLDRGEA